MLHIDSSCNRQTDLTSVRGRYAVTFVCTRPSVDRALASHGETPLYPQCGYLDEEEGGGERGEGKKGRGGGGRKKGRGGKKEGRGRRKGVCVWTCM